MPVLPPGLSPEFLEPILKAELSKHKFLNLGGFLFGALVDATLFGMMMVMLGEAARQGYPRESGLLQSRRLVWTTYRRFSKPLSSLRTPSFGPSVIRDRYGSSSAPSHVQGITAT
jgi:hypothetical protein